MAEGMSNDDLQAIVDSYKRAQMERSQADALKHREGRWEHSVYHAVVGPQRIPITQGKRR